jgi:nucleoid-associated protein YgaU
MTALWLEPTPRSLRAPGPAARPDLRVLGSGRGRPCPADLPDWDVESRPLRLVDGSGRRPRRQTSIAVRRRRTLLAVAGLLLVGLALPLGGTGGHSHAAGSALAGTGKPLVYTVQPGDTLWSIAQQVAPSADPRPLVAELAARTGSDTVTPGETILVP